MRGTALVVCCMAFLTDRGLGGEPGPAAKSIPQLIRDLRGHDAEAASAAKEELGKRGDAAVPALVALVNDRSARRRDVAVISLGMIKDPDTVPLLIQWLDDSDWRVRGRAAYALSQIDGDRAKDALVAFLDRCVKDNTRDLTKAAESLKQLPDRRAFPSLLRVVQDALHGKRRGYAVYYAAEALGKIGDPRAAEPLVRLLDPKAPYSRSRDYLYLEAILRTKGQNALPGLVAYLEALVERMKDYPEAISPGPLLGKEARQRSYDSACYVKTIACLEAISGHNSAGSTRAEVLSYWQSYLAELKRKRAARNLP